MDTNKLKGLAERATPGPWVIDAQQSGAIFNIENESGDLCIAMSQENPAPTRIEMNEQRRVNAAYIAAANPQAILGLIQELEENEGVINVWRGRTQRAEAEVERLRKLEARQQEITEHYKKWFKEIVYESFDEWLKDDATHWIGEEDAALQAWQYLHENKIWLMKERIEEQEQERARIKAENEALRKAFDEANEMLARIGDFAHDKSTGPAVPDVLWEIRGMAYSAVRIDLDAALEGGER